MKKMLNFKKVLMVLIFLIPAILTGFNTANAGPKLEFEESTHDFGKIEQNQLNKFKFKFRNAGDEDLEIKEVKPSCGCTAALLSSKITKPGASGEIEVTFNSGKFKGNVKKSVSVETNEVQVIGGKEKPTSVHKLLITATVKYDKKKEEALRKARELRMKKSKDIKDTEVMKEKREIEQARRAKQAALDRSRLSAVTEPPSRTDVDYHPKSIALGKIDINHDYKRMVKLINLTSSKEFVIEKAEVAVPFIAPMINKKSMLPNNPGEVEIIINAKKAGTLEKGVVSIYVDVSTRPIEIPISWETE